MWRNGEKKRRVVNRRKKGKGRRIRQDIWNFQDLGGEKLLASRLRDSMTGNECNFRYDSPRLTIETPLIGCSAGRHGGQLAE